MNKEKIRKCAFLINYFPFMNSFRFNGNERIIKGSTLIKCKIRCHGVNNMIEIKRGVILYNCSITIFGNNNRIIIDENTIMKYANLNIEDSRNFISIGKNSNFCGKINIGCIEGTKIMIGDNCLLSSEIEIRSGDSHGIYDATGKRINGSHDVIIKDSVWIGQRVMILKGAIVSSNSVVGAGAIVTRKFANHNCIISGVPAKVIKENILWDKNRKSILKIER